MRQRQSVFLFLLAFVCFVCEAPPALAQAVFHPELREAKGRLEAARGAEAYAALRRVWGTWDSSDPAQVEELLLAVERDPGRPAAVRAYAGTLTAYARIRRGDVVSAQRKLKALGFVDRWLVLGPFDNEGKSGLDAEFGPEREVGQAIVPGRAYTGKERPVRWRQAPDRFRFGWLDTSALVRPEQHVCVMAKAFVRAKPGTRTPRPLTLWLGASGAFKLWFDGELRLTDSAYRGHDTDRFASRVLLGPGLHPITLKLCGAEEAPVASLRLGDRDGAPDPELEVIADPSSSPPAASDAARTAGGDRAGATDLGPLRELERRVSSERPSARDLSALAEYLVYTSGDDPSEHKARDYARRAAEAAPTVERMLLAGELAEDRNQAADWLKRAETLAGERAEQDIPLLLAQADHARGSVNWRDAFPLYERVLALDPDRIEGIQGKVELYNEAGLPRTALAVLERAVERNPVSVNLLNMYAGQLGMLGRASEAMVAEGRYAALRFDDRGLLERRIALAVRRRERSAAERWIERLLELAPDSQWAYSVAARAYRGLGQPERAIASYRGALELAPEDAGTLRTLADLEGELGMREDQLARLRKVLELSPQDRQVREYLEHVEPPKLRPDEAYAWPPKRFLGLRDEPAAGENRRTLRNLTVTTVYANGKSSKFRQVVFQPLTDGAAAGLRQYGFQYQADREVVRLRGARVFRKSGRIDEAVESGEGAADVPEISMYTSARTFYVQLPRLEPGDVVELKYRIDDITPRNEFADYFGDIEYLQSTEPVANAEYVLITPKSRKLLVDAKLDGLRHSVSEKGDRRIHRFFVARVPALVPEPSMPPLPEVAGFVHVSTYADWAQMGKWYWGLAKDQFDLDDETRKLARDVAKNAKTDREKVDAVFDWVVKNTRYVALEFGIYGYKPRRCVQTVARGWGDCKDKATVIVSLLRELGVPSTIVIVRTQLRGDLRSGIASLAPFDHAIAYVPSLDLYLDGTAEYAGASELPPMDLGSLALQINEGNPKLVRLPGHDPDKNVARREVQAVLQPDGSARLDVSYETMGSTAPEWRQRFHAKSTQRDRVQNALVGQQFTGFAIAEGPTGLQTSDLEDLTQPVRIRVRGVSSAFARREGAQLSMAVTPGARLTPAFASLGQRRHDVRILAFPSIDETFSVKLPPGMKVVSLPGEASRETPFGSYSVKVEHRQGEVVVRSRVALKTSRVSPAQYPEWQRFCAEVDAALTPRLLVAP